MYIAVDASPNTDKTPEVPQATDHRPQSASRDLTYLHTRIYIHAHAYTHTHTHIMYTPYHSHLHLPALPRRVTQQPHAPPYYCLIDRQLPSPGAEALPRLFVVSYSATKYWRDMPKFGLLMATPLPLPLPRALPLPPFFSQRGDRQCVPNGECF